MGIAYGGVDVYRGVVWNLWNAYNYEEPFEAVNLIFGSIGGGLFFDAKNGLKGPWELVVQSGVHQNQEVQPCIQTI